MFAGYLSTDQQDVIADAILGSIGYDPATRLFMLRGLPHALTGLMGGGGSPPKIGLGLDLQFLNKIERLVDGVVPLRAFLRNALELAGTMDSMQPVREAVAGLDQTTSGAPTVDVATIPETKEKITGGHNDMVSVGFMTEGVKAAASVVKLLVPRFDDGREHQTRGAQTIYLGTGWIIAPGLLMTNHHVFNARNEGEAAASSDDLKKQAKATKALFDYDVAGVAAADKDIVELIEWDAGLDYALARFSDDGRAPLRIASKPLPDTSSGNPLPVNIIQHPNGDPKKYGIRNNLVTSVTATDVRYFTDTDGGSSGSPVFDDNWRVVALHRGSAYVKDVKFQGKSEAYVNVGTRIDAILADIEGKHPGLIH